MTDEAADAAAAPSRAYALTGMAFAAGAVACFSLRPVLVKLSYAYIADPVTLLALRMLFASPFFLAVGIWSARRDAASAPIGLADGAQIAGLGFCGYYLASFLDYLGLQYISAGLGRLLLFVYPTVVVVLSAVFLRKPVRRRELWSLALTYGGIALVVSPAISIAGREAGQTAYGAALVFGSAVLFAVYLTFGSRVILRVGSLRFNAWAMLAASFCCIAQFLALRPLDTLRAVPWPAYGLSLTIALASTVVPTFLSAEALRRIGANRVALLGALGPVSTVVLGLLAGVDEAMTPAQLAGAALVLAGVLVVTLKPGR